MLVIVQDAAMLRSMSPLDMLKTRDRITSSRGPMRALGSLAGLSVPVADGGLDRRTGAYPTDHERVSPAATASSREFFEQFCALVADS